jgi:sporadic carbohydrate cluster protein (TIGR04323 family)
MTKKNFAGYINLTPLNGVLYPSSIQNIIIKNFIENNLKGIFYLSPTEVLQAKFPVTLNTLISKETKVSGIIMLSSFLLPNCYNQRKIIYHKLLDSQKKLFFIFDELKIDKKKDIEKTEEFLIFNNSYFTETKKYLSAEEKSFMKHYNDISFV